MTKNDFVMLSNEEKVNFINAELKIKPRKQIAEEMGVSESYLSAKICGLGYIYDRTLKQYVEEENKFPQKETITSKLQERGICLDTFVDYISKKLESPTTEPVIIKREFITVDKIQRTFVLPEEVFKQWQEFCEKLPEYRSQDLHTMALVEYMEKHNT